MPSESISIIGVELLARRDSDTDKPSGTVRKVILAPDLGTRPRQQSAGPECRAHSAESRSVPVLLCGSPIPVRHIQSAHREWLQTAGHLAWRRPSDPIGRSVATQRQSSGASQVWQTRSTVPMSMPSSSEAVATTARNSPFFRRDSASRRVGATDFHDAVERRLPQAVRPRACATRSDKRRVFTKTSVVRLFENQCRPADRRRRSKSRCWPRNSVHPAELQPPNPSRDGARRRQCACRRPGRQATSSTGLTVAERPIRCAR